MEDQKKVEVSVFVPVYNHREYIAQTLDSILMQKVTFPYEIVIHGILGTISSYYSMHVSNRKSV